MTMLPAAMSLLLEHLQMAYYEKYSVLKVEAVNMPFLNAVKMLRQNHARLNFLLGWEPVSSGLPKSTVRDLFKHHLCIRTTPSMETLQLISRRAAK